MKLLKREIRDVLNAWKPLPIPTSKRPLKGKINDFIMRFHFYTVSVVEVFGHVKVPGLNYGLVPGDFLSEPVLEIANVTVNGSRGTWEVQPTGYYLPAGKVLKMTVLQGGNVVYNCDTKHVEQKHDGSGYQ